MNVNPDLYPQNFVGHGDFGNVETLENLQKALSAGSGVDASSFTGGRALIPESLENTLVNVLWSQDEARLFQRIKKKPISSPVHQWDKRTAVGASDGAWVPEAGTSTEADQTIARVYKTAKYLQTLRKATLQATLSNMIEPAMTLQQNAGALWIIREVEKAMFYGNSSFVSEQPDGLLAQIDSDNVLDVRGASADSAIFETKLNESTRMIREQYGKASLVLMSPMVMQDVQALIRDRIRFEAGNAGYGTGVYNRYPTPFGELELLDDVFITEGGAPAASTITASRPGTPTEDVAAAAAGTGSSFTAADEGDYFYKIEAINKYGASAALTCTEVTVAAGESVTISVGYGDPVPTAFKVYRSKKDAGVATDCRYLKTVAATGDPTVITDDNSDLPGTSQAFILTMDQVYDAIEWFQFLPLMKFDLYPTNAAVYPFLMLLFGALALKKEEQHAYIKNIAPSNLDWF